MFILDVWHFGAYFEFYLSRPELNTFSCISFFEFFESDCTSVENALETQQRFYPKEPGDNAVYWII